MSTLETITPPHVISRVISKVPSIYERFEAHILDLSVSPKNLEDLNSLLERAYRPVDIGNLKKHHLQISDVIFQVKQSKHFMTEGDDFYV